MIKARAREDTIAAQRQGFVFLWLSSQVFHLCSYIETGVQLRVLSLSLFFPCFTCSYDYCSASIIKSRASCR